MAGECVCSPVVKRRREHSESRDGGKYDDVVATAMEVSSAYGVLWEYFGPKTSAFSRARELLLKASCISYYVGVCKCPSDRFLYRSSSHMLSYQQMHVVSVGTNLGEHEKDIIKKLEGVRTDARCDNKTGGGEFCHKKSIKFLYVCVRTHQPQLLTRV